MTEKRRANISEEELSALASGSTFQTFGRTKMPDEKKFIVSLTEQELDDIDGGLSWTIDQMCPSDLWMEPRIKALREKIRRKLKRIRQKEDEK